MIRETSAKQLSQGCVAPLKEKQLHDKVRWPSRLLQPDVRCTSHILAGRRSSFVTRCPGRQGVFASLCRGARGSHKFGPGVAFVPTCQGAGAHMCAGHFAMFGQRLLFIHVCERKSSIALVSRPQLRAHFLSSSIIIYFHEWFGENNFLSAF